MTKIISKAQLTQEILKTIEAVKELMHASVTAVDDPTRVYEYGATVRGDFNQSPTKRINDMRDWCNETFGPRPYGEYYGDRWTVSNSTFWFKHERDRTMFLLRWSS
jgi:hypothetical protein